MHMLKLNKFTKYFSLQMISHEGREQAVNNLVEIIKFRTISGEAASTGEYDACGNWLLRQLQVAGLTSEIIPESKPNKPIVVGKWEGLQPELPALLLNGHYDVVPVLESEWTVPAFEGLQKDGRIYGRGSQDMKSVCIQYLTAIQTLNELGYTPARTILVSFVPDEETGGIDGMNILLTSKWFNSFEIACALDEGLASENDDYSIFYGERLPWWIQVEAKGNTGHASRFIDGTAVEQLLGVANKAMEFRQHQKTLLHGHNHHHQAGCSHSVAAAKKRTLGDVTSLNITVLNASVIAGGSEAINVIPGIAEMKMDIRISPHMEPATMAGLLDGWCQEISSKTTGLPDNGGVHWKQINKTPSQHHVTSCDPAENPWYNLFLSCIQSHCGIKLNPSVFPAATDSRFLRAMGIKAFGFSPIRRSPILLHEHDEYLAIDVFIEGCEIYARLLRALTLSGVFEPYVDPNSIEFKTGGTAWGCPVDYDEDDGGDSSACPMGYVTGDLLDNEEEEKEEEEDGQYAVAGERLQYPDSTSTAAIDVSANLEEKTATTEPAEPPSVPSVPSGHPKVAAGMRCPYGFG